MFYEKISLINSATEPSLSSSQHLAQLQDENRRLKQQLDWFKKQIFGRKSEKRLISDSSQPSLFAETPSPKETSTPKESITYQRRKGKQRSENCVTDKGIRFDDTVPVEVINIPASELQGELLSPIAESQLQQILQSKVLAMDAPPSRPDENKKEK